jgi:hypothetical protein
MRGFLFEVFLYFFTLAASTHGSRMQLDSTLAYEIFRSPLLKGHQSQGMLLGTSQELFFIILRLSALMHGTTSPLLDSATIRSELLLIDMELLQFLMNLMDSSLPNNGNSEPVLCSKLYGLACRLIVKKTLQPTLPDNDDSIQEIVSAFSTSLELLSPTSLAHGVLCWPVVIIGLSAINGKHRSLVTARLKTIQEVWRSDIPLQSAKYLAQKWKEDKNRSFEGASTTVLGSVYRQDILELPVILV